MMDDGKVRVYLRSHVHTGEQCQKSRHVQWACLVEEQLHCREPSMKYLFV